MGRLIFDAKNLALPLHVDVRARRHVFQLIGCTSIAGHIPNLPQRAVFAAQPPQSERLDTIRLRQTHVIQRRHTVEKPDVVLHALLVEIAEVRIHCVVVELHVFVGVARGEPGILHADRLVVFARRQILSVLGLQCPVVSVVCDGADDFFLRDNSLRKLQILLKPVLRRDRP